MAYAHNVLDVLDFFKRDDCYNPQTACLFLLEEMEQQDVDATDILSWLNHQCWELIPVSELEEYQSEFDAKIITDDIGLCGLVLVQMV